MREALFVGAARSRLQAVHHLAVHARPFRGLRHRPGRGTAGRIGERGHDGHEMRMPDESRSRSNATYHRVMTEPIESGTCPVCGAREVYTDRKNATRSARETMAVSGHCFFLDTYI